MYPHACCDGVPEGFKSKSPASPHRAFSEGSPNQVHGRLYAKRPRVTALLPLGGQIHFDTTVSRTSEDFGAEISACCARWKQEACGSYLGIFHIPASVQGSPPIRPPYNHVCNLPRPLNSVASQDVRLQLPTPNEIRPPIFSSAAKIVLAGNLTSADKPLSCDSFNDPELPPTAIRHPQERRLPAIEHAYCLGLFSAISLYHRP
ncbi:hypothetical protein H4582DRAFT_1490269 [Lactarius indigo]|nr:hypothetical protein H4582DRAFT_1490269 [Lactarius indigo]